MGSKLKNPYLKLTALLQKADNTIDNIGRNLEQKRFRLYPSIAGSVFFLALSVFIFLMMPSQIKIRPDQTITARTFPAILAFIMLGGAILNLVKDGIKLIRKETIPFIEVYILTEVKALIILLFLIIYALLIPLTGFSIASVIYGILMLIYFRIKNWKYYILVSILALMIGYLFKDILHVRLP